MGKNFANTIVIPKTNNAPLYRNFKSAVILSIFFYITLKMPTFDNNLIIVYYLLCARLSSKHFTCIHLYLFLKTTLSYNTTVSILQMKNLR